MPKQHLVIFGGGLCGLYAAHTALKLGAEVSIFEKENKFGGLAAGHHHEGNWYDLGVHMLHAFDQEIFETCCEAMGTERTEVPLKSHIKWGGKLYHYPLRGRDILAGIPPFTLVRCIIGLILAEIESRFPSRQPGTDAESALIELYGSPLYEFFFEHFTHRYWGIHPKELSAEFVRRKMPRLSAVDVFKNALQVLHLSKPRDMVEGALRFETLHYSQTGSETLPRSLADHVRKQGAILFNNCSISSIHHNENEITHFETNGKKHKFDSANFISTIPLPILVQLLSPSAPDEVIAASKQLKFKAMTVYALLVKKQQCMDALYTYYRDRVFHRVGEPKNGGLTVSPSDHTTLIVETTCEPGDEKWNGNALAEILQDLAAENLCTHEEVVSHHLIHSRYAYPIFSLGFENHLAIIQNYLSQFKNLRSTGRQGAFSYPNMHSTMRMGADVVRELLVSLEKN